MKSSHLDSGSCLENFLIWSHSEEDRYLHEAFWNGLKAVLHLCCFYFGIEESDLQPPSLSQKVNHWAKEWYKVEQYRMATSPGCCAYWGDNRSNAAIWAGCAMTDFGNPTAPGVNWTLDNLWLSKVRQRDVGVGVHALLWMRHQLWFRASVWHPPINSYELSI